MALGFGTPRRNDGVLDQTASSPRLGLPGPSAREGTPGTS
jgi:hypothetical protein